MPHKDKEANRAYMSDYMRNRYQRRREEAISSLGGQCVKCGSKDELQFHHIDSNTKLFALAKGSSFSNERWHSELEKCQLLCRTCHTEHHRNEDCD